MSATETWSGRRHVSWTRRRSRRCAGASASRCGTRPGRTTRCRRPTPSGTSRGPTATTTRSTPTRRYAAASSWGSPIAPPLYPFAAGHRAPGGAVGRREGRACQAGDPLAGIGQYMCGERWLFPKPIRAGDVLWQYADAALRGPEAELVRRRHRRARCRTGSAGRTRPARRSRSASSTSGTPIGRSRGRPAKNRTLEHAQLHRRGPRPDRRAATRPRSVRGADAPLVADVQVGDELGPIAKGPLERHRHRHLARRRRAGGCTAAARRGSPTGTASGSRSSTCRTSSASGTRRSAATGTTSGRSAWVIPAAYDYGVMRTNWMVHLVTNWMGDDAWIWKVSASVRKFNYLGDAHLISGVVREVDRGRAPSTIAVTGVNQRGEVTCDAYVVVILPPPRWWSGRDPRLRAERGARGVGPVSQARYQPTASNQKEH